MKTKAGETISKISIYNPHTGKTSEVFTIIKSDAEWRSVLSDKQFDILRKKGTERPFTGTLNKNKEKGYYACAACGTYLFSSKDKFDSGTGWPSFTKAINIKTKIDKSLFMQRIEVLCARCGGHLGHVFDDGPAPTHKRFCINSAAMTFSKPKE